MNIQDLFGKLGSKRPIDTSVAAARLNRLRGQNRILPPRTAKIQGKSGFWLSAKANVGTLLSQAQYLDLRSMEKGLINPAFERGTNACLVIDSTQRTIKEIFFFATLGGNMTSLDIKSFSLFWNPATSRFERN